MERVRLTGGGGSGYARGVVTLFLAAVREELGSLPGEVVGVGPVPAAARAAALVATLRPARVVLVGTAGAYGEALELGRPIAASSLGWSSGVAALGLGYVPRPPAPLAADPAMLAALGLPRHPVLTTAAITTDPELAERLGEGWAAEHLEAYGVARACADLGVPFAAVLGISNRVGPRAHDEWLAWRERAQDAARAAAAALADAPAAADPG